MITKEDKLRIIDAFKRSEGDQGLLKYLSNVDIERYRELTSKLQIRG